MSKIKRNDYLQINNDFIIKGDRLNKNELKLIKFFIASTNSNFEIIHTSFIKLCKILNLKCDKTSYKIIENTLKNLTYKIISIKENACVTTTNWIGCVDIIKENNEFGMKGDIKVQISKGFEPYLIKLLEKNDLNNFFKLLS